VIGSYPTPVQHLADLSTPRTQLWVKRDDATGELYGGNKVRRLEHILDQARARGARRILTVGAAGSHHVLACSVYGTRAGFEVAAILTPQPRTEHAVNTLRAAIGQGLEAHAAPSILGAPFAIARALRRGDFLLGPGGSSVTGTTGYIDAIAELYDQINNGDLLTPDAIVVALGSAGTTAGILAGCVGLGLPSKILAVRIVPATWMGKLRVVRLARRAGQSRQLDVPLRLLSSALEIEGGYLGGGYGRATDEGARATDVARRCGLHLDPTYTAKAFAAALRVVESGRFQNVLYWHTLSGAPISALLAQAPKELPPALERLFLD
jgi:1-aminocyclopropane-1-carboxylate deaminase/D-cysteine desulfhydrase-like pyridoxal-dependent ACC family enzyme